MPRGSSGTGCSVRPTIGVGLIDATWPDRFPDVLADRLREILADPDG